MTTLKKSGTDDELREAQPELKAGSGVTIGDTKYEYGADLHTDGTPLMDPATGKTLSIRLFQFKMNPEMIKEFPTEGQVLFNAHAKQIGTMLWADGLIPLDSVPPRVIINKKDFIYQIFVPCEARLSTVFAERPKSLAEQLKGN